MPTAPSPVGDGFVHPEYLVSTDWLAEHLDDPDVVVLDVTAKLTSKLDNEPGRELWEAGHIPGSQFFDVPSAKGVLSDSSASLPWMWPPADELSETLQQFGVGADTRAILVARTPRPGIDSGTMWCTRAWWTLHHSGVDCAILHGGIERWEAEGHPLTAGASAGTGAPSRAVSLRTDWERARATKADVEATVGDLAGGATDVCLIDALPAENFQGTDPGYGRPGHITGAVSIPFRGLIDAETAGFVDAATMRTRLARAGALDADRVVVYCGGAIAATVDAFCLTLLGHEHVSVYDGSLMEWTADPEAPMTNPTG